MLAGVSFCRPARIINAKKDGVFVKIDLGKQNASVSVFFVIVAKSAGIVFRRDIFDNMKLSVGIAFKFRAVYIMKTNEVTPVMTSVFYKKPFFSRRRNQKIRFAVVLDKTCSSEGKITKT